MIRLIYINFKTISGAYYKYLKTYDESQNRQMDVFNNIENGYGIFATRSNGGGFYNLNLQSKGHLKNIEELNFIR